MLLVIDIGNTSISFGLFYYKKLVKHFRIPTREVSGKRLEELLRHEMRVAGSNNSGAMILKGACISSVVPKINKTITNVIKKTFHCPILLVDSNNSGIKIKDYNPTEVGADRLVNAVAAYQRYKRSLIIVDFGTATTFDYVTAKGEYAGGAIAPGIETVNRALAQMTARLPNVPIKKTKHIIGQRTAESMQAGVFHGYVGLVDHIVQMMKEDVGTNPMVIATGGLAKVIAPSTKSIKKVDPFLTLDGLRIIWNNLQNKRSKTW